MTLVLITGAIWAQEAWTKAWSWDPKEVWALITWLTYAAYLHVRVQRGVRGITMAWLSLIGFAIVLDDVPGSELPDRSGSELILCTAIRVDNGTPSSLSVASLSSRGDLRSFAGAGSFSWLRIKFPMPRQSRKGK